MNGIRQLIQEVHRRSLWQVLGIFLAASWAVLQVIEVLTETAGLPDWTPAMALVLLLIGLPICLATAFVQEGLPGGEEDPAAERAGPGTGATGSAGSEPDSAPTSGLRGLLTWRRTVLSGLGGLAILVGSVVVYLVMWSSGIGPVGNLVAQGVIEEGDRVVLAEFSDGTDEDLGTVVTGALRVDLAESGVLRLVDLPDLEPALRRMRLEPGTALTPEVAREVAAREGFEAVLEGDVRPAGTGYIVTATLRAAEDGSAIASFRATASDASEIIDSIDKLSQDIREKAGESLRQIKAGPPLEDVTTHSLEALRLFTEASAVFGETTRAIELLEQAVAVDSTFSSAWRALAAAYRNQQNFPASNEAGTMAFRHRQRLGDRERYLTEAYYYGSVVGDDARSIEAYRNVLSLDPENAIALNNLSNRYNNIGERERGRELLRRAVSLPNASSTSFGNLVLAELFFGEVERAAQVLADWEEAFPQAEGRESYRISIALLAGGIDEAEVVARRLLEDPDTPPFERIDGAMGLAKVAYARGRIDEAAEHASRAIAIGDRLGPTFGRVQRLLAAFMDALVGDRARARGVVEAVMADETAAPMLADPRGPAVVIVGVLVFTGATPQEAEDAWHAMRGSDATDPRFARAMAMARALAGEGGVLAEVERLRSEAGCLTEHCWREDRAYALLAEGRAGEAVELLETLARSRADLPQIMGVVALDARLRLGPAYEAAGRPEDAIRAYRRIVDQWAGADEKGMETVRRFRARIEALGGGGT